MSALNQPEVREVKSSATDWWCKCGGVILVFPDGRVVRLNFQFATSGESGVRFDPDPTKGEWCIDGGKVSLLLNGLDGEDGKPAILVGPPGSRDGESLLVSAELVDQQHVVYHFVDRFRALRYAVLPRCVFNVVEGRQRMTSDGESLIQSGGKSLFVACCLVERWLEKTNLFDAPERVNYLSAHMKDMLNQIARVLSKLGTADGMLFAAEQLIAAGEVQGCS